MKCKTLWCVDLSWPLPTQMTGVGSPAGRAERPAGLLGTDPGCRDLAAGEGIS